jgi:predicted cobalt transporter CbtA
VNLRRTWARVFAKAPEVQDDVDEVPISLAYELQSKMFDQLATVSIAAVGLSVTLLGSLLRGAPPQNWLVVVMFGMAGFTAVVGNNHLIEGLHRKQPTKVKSKIYVRVSLGLIALATGVLSSAVYVNAPGS